MKIVIAGGAGFVGRNLIRILKENGFKSEHIVVLDSNMENLKFLENTGVKLVTADLSQKGEWEDELLETDYLINLTAQISSPDYEPFERNNIIATKNLIEAAKNANLSKIIHFSSAAVLSVRKDNYAKTKLEGEDLVKNSGLTYCILRPSLMYGLTDDKNIGYLIDFADKYPFFPIPGSGKWPRQPVYIDDICELVISFTKEFPENQIYNINGKESIFFKDMIKSVLHEVDGYHFRLFLPVKVFKLAMMFYQKINGGEEFTLDQVDSLTSKEVFPDYPWWDEFNIQPTNFDEGVRRMIQQEDQDK